jgi:hypothetical protein
MVRKNLGMGSGSQTRCLSANCAKEPRQKGLRQSLRKADQTNTGGFVWPKRQSKGSKKFARTEEPRRQGKTSSTDLAGVPGLP